MMKLDGYFVLILIVALLVRLAISMLFADAAREKGYNAIFCFFTVLFLGIFGILYIAILPCKQNINSNIE